MGGAKAGEVASAVAVEAVEGATESGEPTETQLANIVRQANRRIYDLAVADESRRGMGTTLTLAKVHGDEVSLAHVGDSRAYRCAEASSSSSRAITRSSPSSSAAGRSRRRRRSTIRSGRSSHARSGRSRTSRWIPTRSRDATAMRS